LRREDFAYGMELTVSGKNAMYSLTLPADIYKGCTRPDLGDLRVFNAHGGVEAEDGAAVAHLGRTDCRGAACGGDSPEAV
jgi:hypothetical protein